VNQAVADAPGLPRAEAKRGRTLLAAQLAIAALLLLGLALIANHLDPRPRRQAIHAVPDTVRTLLATAVVFGLGGFGLVRLLLPATLRRYELLWVLPTGGCVVGLVMTVLGFAAVPYPVSLVAVLLAGAAFAVYAVRRCGWPELSAMRLVWPVYLGAVVLAVALVPMVFHLHYSAPVGTGSDAHNATGSAQFLMHSYPTSVNVSQPLNQIPPTWQSKFPIYYAFAAVTSLTGLQTWQVIVPLAAAMLTLAAVGMFLVARELFRAPFAVSLVAMGVAALDREALHTVLNPYFNQTWGFFALPFTLVLGWWIVQPGESRRSRQGIGVLLALFALVLVFAYPLAAPIPAVPIVVFVWMERRRRIAAGEHVFRLRDLYRGRRSLIWIVPLAAALAVPVIGVAQKAIGAAEVLAPGHSLLGWKGDLPGFIPWNYFFSLPNSVFGAVVFVAVIALAAWGLAGAPRALAWGLGGLFVIGLLLGVYFRQRAFGEYFEFKLLAFVGPLVLLSAAVGAGRLRSWGAPALLAVLVGFGAFSVADELDATGYQLPQATIQLTSWADSLPKGASIRLDMWPPDQLWAAYFLVSHPLCSQLPLLGTDYAHVPTSRKADYIVATNVTGRPKDAIGPPLAINTGYTLYRENPAVPGPSYCSQRRQDRLYTGAGYSPY
jgi:hypothetical protein